MTDRIRWPGKRALQLPGRRALVVLCVSVALLATGCDGGGESGGGHSTTVPVTPSGSVPPPSGGKGSDDPDDLNGDGHRDLLLPMETGIAVVFGSADGLDPETHTVYSAGLNADLDSDGYPDLLSRSSKRLAVAWGSPKGPGPRPTTPLRVPGDADLGSLVRGDFDGDGHHDLAGLRTDDSSGIVLLYGPFTRAGTPARTDTRPGREGRLVADEIAPTGTPRATGLMIHETNDGEQSPGVLFSARTGRGLSHTTTLLRKGNAFAFGDYDGDGVRDLAVGDDGSRNNEPGYETEAPDVDGSLTVYPGDGGAPVDHKVPRSVDNPSYGAGGYVSADPDGDGKDGILVTTDEGALLIDGDKRTEVLRRAPATMNGEKTPEHERNTRPYAAADFDDDGKDELVLNWAPGGMFDTYGEHPTHWWITDGTTSRDEAVFATTGFQAF